MKLVLLSDVHASSQQPIARKDKYLQSCMSKLHYVYKFAKKRKAHVLQTGDLFDRTRDWLLLTFMMDLFKKYKGVKTYAVEGQHDKYLRVDGSPATTIGILVNIGYIKIVKSTLLSKKHVCLYGAGWNQKLPPVNPLVLPHDYNILITHAPIAVDRVKGVSVIGAKTYLKKHVDRFDLILCGDIHRSFNLKLGKTTIINTGPMMRKEATKYNFTHKPHFYLLDTKTRELTKKYIPVEDADEVLSRDHIEREREIGSIMSTFFDAVEEIDPDDPYRANLMENLYLYMAKINVNQNILEIIERKIDAEQD